MRSKIIESDHQKSVSPQITCGVVGQHTSYVDPILFADDAYMFIQSKSLNLQVSEISNN